MAFRRFRKRFNGVSFKAKKQLSRARKLASTHRKKASTLTTVALALGAFLAYDKFVKK